jgi:5-methylcytosine-specific restriction endonuclease McrA
VSIARSGVVVGEVEQGGQFFQVSPESIVMPIRIPSHKPARIAARPRRDDTARPSAHERGYCDKRHRAWRRAVLTRDCWQCRTCQRVCGGAGEAHADHVVPISQGGARYDVANGQTLCLSCHSRKTRREQGSRPLDMTGHDGA